MSGRTTLRGVIATVLVAALAVVAGCGSGGDAAPSAEEGGTRTITTDRGPLEVPADPQRIVVLSGGLAGYLYALDEPPVAADTRVLGITNFAGGFPPAWAGPATAAGTEPLPAGEQLSVEAVAAAKPDLIIGGGQGITAVQAAQAYDRLAAIAPTVLVPRTVTGWQDQLTAVADAANAADRVPALLQRYQDRLQQVRSSITPPQGETVFIATFASQQTYVVPSTAALPALAAEAGLQPTDVVERAPQARLASTGDGLEISPELLGTVADSPNAIVVNVGGRSLDQLRDDPAYAALPAFRAGRVWELPATSYRPDLDGALGTLDELGRIFGPAAG